jgi:hypothetical protein
MRTNLDPTQAVVIRGEIGTVAYASDRYMVNEFSDMSLADALIEQAGYKNLPWVGPLMQFNFLWRQDHPPLPAPHSNSFSCPATTDSHGASPKTPHAGPCGRAPPSGWGRSGSRCGRSREGAAPRHRFTREELAVLCLYMIGPFLEESPDHGCGLSFSLA